MHTDATNGATSAPGVIDPVQPTQALYEGSFAVPNGSFGLGDAAFVVICGVNSGGVSGWFLQRFAADGAASQFSGGLANAGPGLVAQIVALDSSHFVMNLHAAANPTLTSAIIFDLNGAATSAAVGFKHDQISDVTPVALSDGSFVEVIRGAHPGHNVLSMRAFDGTGAPVSKYIDIGTPTTFADAASFTATALAGGQFAVA